MALVRCAAWYRPKWATSWPVSLLAGKVHDGDTVLVDQTGGEHLELSAWASDQIVSDNPDVSVDNVTEDK